MERVPGPVRMLPLETTPRKALTLPASQAGRKHRKEPAGTRRECPLRGDVPTESCKKSPPELRWRQSKLVPG